MTRDEVYALIQGEREYQTRLWPGHKHTYREYLIFVRDYLQEALHLESRFTGGDGQTKAIVRKVATMCLAAIEENSSSCKDAYLAYNERRITQNLTLWLLDMTQIAEQWFVSARDSHGDLLWFPHNAVHSIYEMAFHCMEEHGAPARDIEGDLVKRQRTVDAATTFVAPEGWKGCKGFQS